MRLFGNNQSALQIRAHSKLARLPVGAEFVMQGLIVSLFVIHHKLLRPSPRDTACLLEADLPLEQPFQPGLLQSCTRRQSSANCCIGSRLYVAPPFAGLLHEE